MKKTLTILIVIILASAGLFSLQYLGLLNYKFFEPKYENARRQVFENTQSYVEGKRQEILKYKLEYSRAKTKEEKEAIRYTILQTTANLDLNLLSPDLRYFVLDLRNKD